MRNAENRKIYCFVDESGDPIFFDRKGSDLVKKGEASPIFMVGYIEVHDNKSLSGVINSLHDEIAGDEYLKSIPSFSKSVKHFHAKDDSPEIREKVFKVIKSLELKTFIIVARKDSEQFIKRFNGKPENLYTYCVEKLFENRLHLYSDIDIYFSKMGNVVRENNMKSAISNAMYNFRSKWGKENESNIRLFIQEPSQMAGLQVVDYLLWAVYRVFVKEEIRYFNFLKEKYSLIHDIFDSVRYPGTYYTKDNPLDTNKISPLTAR